MPHFPKPFYKSGRKTWYLEIDRKQYNLNSEFPDRPPLEPDDLEEANERAVLLKQRLRTKSVKTPASEPNGSPLLVAIFDQFLSWCRINRSERTYDSYRERIQCFVKFLGGALTVEELRVFHVQQWVDSQCTWNDGMKRGQIGALQRALNWAVEQQLVDASPIAGMRKPAQGRRDNVIEQETYSDMKTLIENDAFLDLISVAWECGPRPNELLRVEARHAELDRERWLFPKEEAKGKKRIRIVYLTPNAVAMTRKLLAQHPQGKLFRNSDGDPWTPWSVNNAFCRLQRAWGRRELAREAITISDEEIEEKVATLAKTKTVRGKVVPKAACELRREARKKLRTALAQQFGHKYALYDFRHSWMTRLLKNGVDPITISVLAGHVDTTILTRHYAHINTDERYLREALERGITIPNVQASAVDGDKPSL